MNVHRIYDVIIVGGGPAGGSAAFYLARAGRSVLVLEKERLPRYKVCGGAVPARALAAFPFSFEPVIQARAHTAVYQLGKRQVRMPLPEGAICMVMRDEFDAYLLEQSGAEVRQGETVRRVQELDDRVLVETAGGETLAGRYIIGADGANSVVRRDLGLRRKSRAVAAIEVEAPAAPELFERFDGAPLFVFGAIPLGYLWVFPKSGHLSVGIAAMHPQRGELQARLRQAMAAWGLEWNGRLVHGHPIPLFTGRERIATSRGLLVGDAAGLVDPLTGEGIRFALKSGQMAAQAILAGEPERYPALVQRRIGRSHTFGLGLAWLFYHLPELCFILGVRNPFATQAFVDLLSDRAGYPEVIVRLFGTLPLFLATEALAALAGLFGGDPSRQKLREAVYPAAGD